MIEIQNNKCPVCGRFMKVERTEIRTTWQCSNTRVDHDWDEG